MYFPCTMQGFNEWHKELFISFGWMQLVKHHSVYSDMILEKEAYAKRIDAYEDSMKLFLAKISEKIDTNPNNMNIEELKSAAKYAAVKIYGMNDDTEIEKDAYVVGFLKGYELALKEAHELIKEVNNINKQ